MDQAKSFWLDLFTWETWNEFLKQGGKISGFREKRWSAVQKVATGDILLCYLTGISRFIGALEVVGQPFQDIVAPYKRREKVITEINRPTFSRLEPALNEICRFLSFSSLEALFKKFGSDIRFLKPQILEENSEDCALPDAT
jgi:hypothetical protein